jgi:hypothetical protein
MAIPSTSDQKQIESRRNDHSAERSGQRKSRQSRTMEFAKNHLALELERDDEEEERHQPVIDPMFQRAREFDITRGQANLYLPERKIAAGPGCIGKSERDQRAKKQNSAGHRLYANEPQEGRRNPVCRFLGQMREVLGHFIFPGLLLKSSAERSCDRKSRRTEQVGVMAAAPASAIRSDRPQEFNGRPKHLFLNNGARRARPRLQRGGILRFAPLPPCSQSRRCMSVGGLSHSPRVTVRGTTLADGGLPGEQQIEGNAMTTEAIAESIIKDKSPDEPAGRMIRGVVAIALRGVAQAWDCGVDRRNAIAGSSHE